MEVMVFSRWRRAVGRGRGELGPIRLLVVFSLEQPDPGRLGMTSQLAELSPGLQIIELDLYKQKIIIFILLLYKSQLIFFIQVCKVASFAQTDLRTQSTHLKLLVIFCMAWWDISGISTSEVSDSSSCRHWTGWKDIYQKNIKKRLICINNVYLYFSVTSKTYKSRRKQLLCTLQVINDT